MTKDLLISWLNDAYAMERASISLLQSHAKDAEGGRLPEAGTRIREHIDETHTHANRIAQCLKLLGASPEEMTTTFSLPIATLQGVRSSLFLNNEVGNAIGGYGLEQVEVAAYRALITAAEELGKSDIVLLCEDNLHEDSMMATWLEDQLRLAVHETIAKEQEVN